MQKRNQFGKKIRGKMLYVIPTPEGFIEGLDTRTWISKPQPQSEKKRKSEERFI